MLEAIQLSWNKSEPSTLMALGIIESINENLLYNEARAGRLPSHVYNLSLRRVSARCRGYAERIHRLFDESNPYANDRPDEEGLVESLELMLYSAAEHVDDLDRVAASFYRDKKLKEKCQFFKKFDTEIKLHKRLISMLANRVKHEQVQIGISAIKYEIDGIPAWLHGYRFINIKDGVLLSDPIGHKGRYMFSSTGLLWEVIVFLLVCSRSLFNFLKSHVRDCRNIQKGNDDFCDVVEAAMRLPFYEFDRDSAISLYALSWERTEVVGHANWKPLRGSYPVGWGRVKGQYVADGKIAYHSVYVPGKIQVQIDVPFPVLRLPVFV